MGLAITQSFPPRGPPGTREYSVFHRTLGTSEDSVTSAFSILRTHGDPVLATPHTLETREDSVISAPRALGTEYFKMAGTRE